MATDMAQASATAAAADSGNLKVHRLGRRGEPEERHYMLSSHWPWAADPPVPVPLCGADGDFYYLADYVIDRIGDLCVECLGALLAREREARDA